MGWMSYTNEEDKDKAVVDGSRWETRKPRLKNDKSDSSRRVDLHECNLKTVLNLWDLQKVARVNERGSHEAEFRHKNHQNTKCTTHQRGSRDELEERFSPMRGQWKLQKVWVYALAFRAADELRWSSTLTIRRTKVIIYDSPNDSSVFSAITLSYSEFRKPVTSRTIRPKIRV